MRFCQGLCGEDWGLRAQTERGIRAWVRAVLEPSLLLLQLVSLAAAINATGAPLRLARVSCSRAPG